MPLFWQTCDDEQCPRLADVRGTTIRRIGIVIAAAITMRRIKKEMMQSVSDIPQHLLLGLCGGYSSESCGANSPFRRWELPRGNFRPPLDVGVVPGSGKAERISDMLPDARLPFSPALNMSSMPILLAVLPLSRFEASFVARLIRSDRLVVLPRASASRTASIFSRGGRRLEGILSLMPGLGSRPSKGLEEFALVPEVDIAAGEPRNKRGGSKDDSILRGDDGGESSAKGMRTDNDFGCDCNVLGELGAIPAAIAALRVSIVFAREGFGRAASSRISGLRTLVSAGFPRLPRLACRRMSCCVRGVLGSLGRL